MPLNHHVSVLLRLLFFFVFVVVVAVHASFSKYDWPSYKPSDIVKLLTFQLFSNKFATMGFVWFHRQRERDRQTERECSLVSIRNVPLFIGSVKCEKCDRFRCIWVIYTHNKLTIQSDCGFDAADTIFWYAFVTAKIGLV